VSEWFELDDEGVYRHPIHVRPLALHVAAFLQVLQVDGAYLRARRQPVEDDDDEFDFTPHRPSTHYAALLGDVAAVPFLPVARRLNPYLHLAEPEFDFTPYRRQQHHSALLGDVAAAAFLPFASRLNPYLHLEVEEGPAPWRPHHAGQLGIVAPFVEFNPIRRNAFTALHFHLIDEEEEHLFYRSRQSFIPIAVIDCARVYRTHINMSGNEVRDVVAIYFGPKDTNGSWRWLQDGDDLIAQRRESDVYVTKQTITP